MTESSIATNARSVDVQFLVGACSIDGTWAVMPRTRTVGSLVTGSSEKVVSCGLNLSMS